MPEKILISPTSFAKFDRKPLNLLNEYELIINPYGRKMTSQEVLELGKDCIGIIAGVEKLDRTVFEKMPNLKCISRVGVGIDNIDMSAAKEMDIKVRNTPLGPTLAVAEFTISLLFALLRNICQANKNMHEGVWKKEYGFLLGDKSVGVVGTGNIGKAVVERLLPFGCSVITHDINPDNRWLKKRGLSNVPLEELLKSSDIVSLNLSFSKGNKHLISKKEFALMKKGALLINVSRGGIVDEEALLDSLRCGHLAGAAIDVYEQEPYKGELQGLDNVILTPHIGSYAKEGRIKMEIDAVMNLLGEIG